MLYMFVMSLVQLLMRKFMRDQYNDRIRLYGYQLRPMVRILWDILRKTPSTIVLLFPRQTGKTLVNAAVSFIGATVVWVLGALMPVWRKRFKDGFRVVVYAPANAKQGKEVLKRVRSVYRKWYVFWVRHEPRLKELHRSITHYAVGLENEHGEEEVWFSIKALTAGERSEGVEGDTAELVIVEEAQGIHPDIYYAGITPVRDATSGVIVVVGTASLHRDLLYEICQEVKNDDPTRFFHIRPEDVEAANHMGGQWQTSFRKRVKKLGVNHPYIRAKYYNLWDVETGMLVGEEGWRRMMVLVGENAPSPAVDKELLYYLRRYRRSEELRRIPTDGRFSLAVGLDVAKSRDYTVLTIALADNADRREVETLLRDMKSDAGGKDGEDDVPPYTPHLYEIFKWQAQGIEYHEQIETVAKLLAPINDSINEIVVDATADRGDVAPALTRRGFGVIPMEFNKRTKADMSKDFDVLVRWGRYHVVVDQAYCGTDDWLECGGLPTGDDDYFGEQDYMLHRTDFFSAERRVRDDGKIVFVARREDTDHDDHVDSAMLALHSAIYGHGAGMNDWTQDAPRRLTADDMPRGTAETVDAEDVRDVEEDLDLL